jgi:hypothetical protein
VRARRAPGRHCGATAPLQHCPSLRSRGLPRASSAAPTSIEPRPPGVKAPTGPMESGGGRVACVARWRKPPPRTEARSTVLRPARAPRRAAPRLVQPVRAAPVFCCPRQLTATPHPRGGAPHGGSPLLARRCVARRARDFRAAAQKRSGGARFLRHLGCPSPPPGLARALTCVGSSSSQQNEVCRPCGGGAGAGGGDGRPPPAGVSLESGAVRRPADVPCAALSCPSLGSTRTTAARAHGHGGHRWLAH